MKIKRIIVNFDSGYFDNCVPSLSQEGFKLLTSKYKIYKILESSLKMLKCYPSPEMCLKSCVLCQIEHTELLIPRSFSLISFGRPSWKCI